MPLARNSQRTLGWPDLGQSSVQWVGAGEGRKGGGWITEGLRDESEEVFLGTPLLFLEGRESEPCSKPDPTLGRGRAPRAGSRQARAGLLQPGPKEPWKPSRPPPNLQITAGPGA